MKTKMKRIFSSIIDVFVYIFLFSLCIIFSQNVIINNFTNYQDLLTQNNQILLDSGLYEEKDGKIDFIETDIDQKLIVFYSKNSYYDQTHKTFSYENAKEQSGIFSLNQNGDYILKPDVLEEDINAFFEEELYKASIVIANREDYKKLSKSIKNIDSYNTFFTLLAVSFLYIFIIPLCNKKRATIGKLIFNLKVCSETGDKVSIIQLFMRFVAFFAIELLPSLTFYGVTIIISFVLCVGTKKGKSIHDYFALTYVNDFEKGKINEEKNG